MKRITIGLIAFIVFLLGLIARAQDCKVLVDEISVEYKGDCKKGLAHGTGEAIGENFTYKGEFKKAYPDGNGTLTMNNGNVFTGEWKRGKIYGKGELKEENGKVTTGYFKGTITGFIYMGEDKSSLVGYNIIEQKRMENATIEFNKSEEINNKVLIKITENRVRQINNFEVLGKTSGILQRVDNSGGRLMADIDNVTFPITLRIQYILPYGTQDTVINEGVDNLLAPSLLRFTITEPGFWTVNITHR